MKKSYTVVVERDPESTWLVGEVIELPGCYTQAPNLPTLELKIQEAISAYLKTALYPRSHCQTLSAPGESRFQLD